MQLNPGTKTYANEIMSATMQLLPCNTRCSQPQVQRGEASGGQMEAFKGQRTSRSHFIFF